MLICERSFKEEGNTDMPSGAWGLSAVIVSDKLQGGGTFRRNGVSDASPKSGGILKRGGYSGIGKNSVGNCTFLSNELRF